MIASETIKPDGRFKYDRRLWRIVDVDSIRKDFPTIRDGKGVYLDSACQSLKPDCVIEKMVEYYNEYPACGGRSVHSMGTRVSMGVDETREKLANFFGCDDSNEIGRAHV